MLGFFFKKNGYDGWDNVMFIIIPNLILDAVLLIGGALMYFLRDYLSVWIVVSVVLVAVYSLFSLAWAENCREIAENELMELKEFFKRLKGCIPDALRYAAVLVAWGFFTAFGIIFFLFPGSTGITFAGMLAASVWCWVAFTIFQALSWYPAIRAMLHNPFAKALKKCFILFFDNIWVSLVVSFYNLFLFVLSVIMLGIAPGMAGITLSRVNAFRLLLKKYDYIEELDKKGEPKNSRARRKIPWKEILAQDIENTTTRSLKSILMPRKE